MEKQDMQRKIGNNPIVVTPGLQEGREAKTTTTR
jgi:hypothetical protein